MALPVLSIAQMREWEKATWAAGQTETEVIRRVGKCVAERVLGLTRPGDQVVILAGKGHNGDDARCAREHLHERRVDLAEVTNPAAELAKLEALLSLRPALIVDGLFGIGINRPLDPDWRRLIERVNEAGCAVLAVDVPSGLNAGDGTPQGASLKAAVTLTVGAPKIGMLNESAWPYVGRLEVTGDVGLLHPWTVQTELQWTLGSDFTDYPPRRQEASHKGTYGHLGIVSGSPGFHGAAVLAARGAQRAQPGLITLVTLEKNYYPVAAQLQAVMVGTWSAEAALPAGVDSLLAGPGLASAEVPESLRSFVRQAWSESEMPVVIDASALAWLPQGKTPDGSLRIITPHPGEAARLLGSSSKQVQSDRLAALRELSRRYGETWVVLKGHQTLVGRSTGGVYVNSSGNAHLAQGGSGDALSGFIGGLVAQPALRQDPGKTLRYAVWQHGAAADLLQETRRNWVVEDLVSELGNVSQPSARSGTRRI